MNGPLPDDGITTSIWMSKSQRRQLRKLADKVDRITQADCRFFERWLDRQRRKPPPMSHTPEIQARLRKAAGTRP